MTDDGENAELRTAEAGGGAGRGQGRGQVAAPHLEISCAAVCRLYQCTTGPGPDTADAPS